MKIWLKIEFINLYSNMLHITMISFITLLCILCSVIWDIATPSSAASSEWAATIPLFQY